MTMIEERTNGHGHQGRAVPPLATFTFPGSGRVVSIRPLAAMTRTAIAQSIRRESKRPGAEMPLPEPPMYEADYGDNQKIWEPNDADETYIKRMNRWEAWASEQFRIRWMALVARRGVECEIDAEEVAAFRADMAAVGVELPDDDKEVFIYHLCATGDGDLSALADAIVRRSQPTEEAVQEHIATFQADVPGEAAV